MSLDDIKYREKVFKKINKITKKDLYFQIYQIIQDNNEKYTSNSNGVFFDLVKISKKTLLEIDKILDIEVPSTEEYTTSIHMEEEEEDITDIFTSEKSSDKKNNEIQL